MTEKIRTRPSRKFRTLESTTRLLVAEQFRDKRVAVTLNDLNKHKVMFGEVIALPRVLGGQYTDHLVLKTDVGDEWSLSLAIIDSIEEL